MAETMADSGSAQPSKLRKRLDLFEQVIVLVFYAWFIARLWPDELSTATWYPLLILFSEGVVVFFLLIRRRTDVISAKLYDWAIAFAGTFLTLLISRGGDPLSTRGGVMLMLLGLCVHLTAKLSLARSFGLVAADRGVKARGLYAFMRHPMYAGYVMTHVGYLLTAPSLWNLSIYVATWAVFIARILAEERVLQANPEYQAYMTRVRFRLLPGVF